MRPFAGTWAVAWLAIGVGAGCAGEQEALIVVNSVAPMVDDDGCTWSPDNLALRSGILDVGAGGSYILSPVLLNNLPARSGATNSGVDDSELQLQETIDITLILPSDVPSIMAPNGDRLPLSYGSVIATDSLPAGASFVTEVEAIPFEHSRALAGAILPGESIQTSVEIIFHATRTGNGRRNGLGVVDSRVYRFPIEICHDCLLFSCDCDASDECREGSSTYAGACNPGQDAFGYTPFSCDSASPFGTTTGDGMATSSDGGGSSMGSG